MDQFALLRVGPRDWVVQNGRFSRRDARSVVAALHETDRGNVDVLWLQHTTLPTRYASAADAMEAFMRWSKGTEGDRPIPIPHFPPLSPSRTT